MPQLGVITDEISEDLDHALAVCKELGISDIELRSIDRTSIVDHTPERVSTIRDTIVSGGFRVCAISSPFLKCHIHEGEGAAGNTHSAKSASREDHWQILQRSLELAEVFDAPIVRAFSFWRVDDPLAVRDEVLAVLAEATARVARAGRLLGLENEYACNVATGEESAWILERTPDTTLGMIWDPGNEAALGSNPFPAGYDAVKHRIHHVHLKDPVAIAEGTGFTAIGDGAIDYEGQFRALAADGYDGVLSLETHYRIDGNVEQGTRACAAGTKRLAAAAGLDLGLASQS